MNRARWSRVLLIAGLVGMLGGAIDPLEGAFVIVPASGLAWAGAYLGGSRRRRLMAAAFLLGGIGLLSIVILTAMGGVGGASGRSIWWLLTAIPYPAGWLLALFGTVAALLEGRRGSGSRAEGGGPDAGAIR